MLEHEKWRAVADYPHYEVSNFGRVRSLPRYISFIRKGKQVKRIVPAKILKPTIANHGYPVVGIVNDAGPDVVLVHRLVATAWVPNPKGLPVVMHKDDVRTNCYKRNLKWGTSQENVEDMHVKGRANTVRGERTGMSVLTEKQATRALKMLKAGVIQRLVADEFKVSRSTISHLSLGLTWKHLKRN